MKELFLVHLITFFLFLSGRAEAQPTDSTRFNTRWSPYALGVRTAVGYQKTVFTEIGLSYHRAAGSVMAPRAQLFYGSAEWIPALLPKKEQSIYAVKVGYEHTSHLMVSALEGKYSFDRGGRKEMFLIPKIGFGLWGMLNIMYGYSISLSKEKQFNEIGKHQFMLVCNIDKHLIKGF